MNLFTPKRFRPWYSAPLGTPSVVWTASGCWNPTPMPSLRPELQRAWTPNVPRGSAVQLSCDVDYGCGPRDYVSDVIRIAGGIDSLMCTYRKEFSGHEPPDQGPVQFSLHGKEVFVDDRWRDIPLMR